LKATGFKPVPLNINPGFKMCLSNSTCAATVRCGKRRDKDEKEAEKKRNGGDGGGGSGSGNARGGGGGGGNATSMRYIHEGLELSNAELERAKKEEKMQLLRSGKLLLVLDLDHTLLNSARFSELSQEQHDGLHRVGVAAQVVERGGTAADVAVGRYNLNALQTHSLKPPGFNPWAYEVKPGFKVCFQMQFAPLRRGGARGGRRRRGRGGAVRVENSVDP
jgi:hypothetical protein